MSGGANFPEPVWDNSKVWHDRIYVLTRTGAGYEWKDGGTLPRAIAYGFAVSTSDGVVCIGGNDSTTTYADVFLLSWNPDSQKISRVDYPKLPEPCAGGQAALLGNTIYLAGGQNSQKSAMNNFWTLDLSMKNDPEDFHWNKLAPFPGTPRAYNITVQQHNGYDDCIYVISGRNQQGETAEFLKDVWEFTPRTGEWRRRADAPRSVMAGTGIGFGQSHLFILGGDDGENFFKADELRDNHPGFLREALSYHTITNTWSSAGRIPMNQVTTIPVMWDNRIVIASGEIRPRVRTPKIWSISPQSHSEGFGAVNYSVLFGYLLAMVGVGVYFARRNKNTDDYFRGGGHIPWWAAGCSIFATMLSPHFSPGFSFLLPGACGAGIWFGGWGLGAWRGCREVFFWCQVGFQAVFVSSARTASAVGAVVDSFEADWAHPGTGCGGRSCRFCQTWPNNSRYGYASDSDSHTFRHVTRTCAPILSSFTRIVSQRAFA
ncbi:N-acetylneuraminate epimerase precursor [Rubinisphaera italica]|uniref:N-acetylneuraminate epimerase n=1 Tax=Rubinisphaera italica TaxID=2527969 RepID=A0A5C5XR64_9PLAN|nr:N-acetylneuraminate epimerase precursor [Rubinisphaera italica]